MEVFEIVIALLLVGAALGALARRLNLPYQALVALAGAALALVPGTPTVMLDPELALALFETRKISENPLECIVKASVNLAEIRAHPQILQHG